MQISNAIRCTLLFLVTGVLVPACGAANTGQFVGSAFQQPVYKYQIRYLSGPPSNLMPSDWRLDNYYPTGMKQEMTPKTGGIYETEYGFDTDGDGKDDHAEKLLTFELRFTHLRTAGLVWMRAIPVAQYEGSIALDVMLQSYLDGVAGAGFEIARLGSVKRLEEKRYAPHLVSTVPASLAGREALAAVIDIANVDELQVSPNARRHRIKLVIARPGFIHEVKVNKQFPVMLVAGYANQPDYFAQNLPDFDGLLQRLDIGGVTGFIEGPNRRILPPPAPRPVSAPPAQRVEQPVRTSTPGLEE